MSIQVPEAKCLLEGLSLEIQTRANRLTQHPSEANIPSSSAKQGNTTKKARTVGPTRSRPMALVLPSESEVESFKIPSNAKEIEDLGHAGNSVVKGKGKRLERTLSFYPGCHDTTHAPSHLDQGNLSFHTPQVDDEGSVTEEDPMDDEYTVELALKQPNKFSESLAIEVHPNLVSQAARHLPELYTAVGAAQPSVIATELPNEFGMPDSSPQAPWPIETSLILTQGSNKLKLTHQRPMVRVVIQEAIEHLWATMMFNNAFPEFCVALRLIKDCLFTAANHLKPGSTGIYVRLEEDPEYLSRITPLPRARICLIRSEVKERCTTITMGTFLMFGSPLDIIKYVRNQLANYTYTFPKAKIDKCPNRLVMCSRPYRNDHIITVIRDMFFTGGAKSFAKHFYYLFPTHNGRGGEMVLEVPIPMVALVATAVVAEFSANAFLDVYNGHVNTLKHIRERREGAFHLMMADIYAQADMSVATEILVVPIADLDIDDIDG
ncbi:hypothetical protein EI94DRAFT_1703253 [Lactarius quietus]|nr:hypothetical protein EI94DRAFT_1703253 [Lactarius quietus]